MSWKLLLHVDAGDAELAMALRNALTKRETRPPKKHGNMPL